MLFDNQKTVINGYLEIVGGDHRRYRPYQMIPIPQARIVYACESHFEDIPPL